MLAISQTTLNISELFMAPPTELSFPVACFRSKDQESEHLGSVFHLGTACCDLKSVSLYFVHLFPHM